MNYCISCAGYVFHRNRGFGGAGCAGPGCVGSYFLEQAGKILLRRHPDAVSLDVAIQLATAAVFLPEGVEGGEKLGHRALALVVDPLLRHRKRVGVGLLLGVE